MVRDSAHDWRVICTCQCGKVTEVRLTELKAGKSTACLSCSGKRKMANLTEEQLTHLRSICRLGWAAYQANPNRENRKPTRLFKYTPEEHVIAQIMRGARGRCANPTAVGYSNYGGRGIEFRFESTAAATHWVMQHLGPRPDGCSIDRIDNDGHYEAGNLRWATRSQQARNKRAYKGSVYGHRLQRLCIQRPDYSYEGLRKYIKLGWTDAEIIALPKPKGGRPKKNVSSCL